MHRKIVTSTAKQIMSNPTNETFGQARQGSVAAIIQILNERLADAGIRTRAVVDGGVLQVLCEAPSKEHLDQSTIVDRVRQILESISPQRISKYHGSFQNMLITSMNSLCTRSRLRQDINSRKK